MDPEQKKEEEFFEEEGGEEEFEEEEEEEVIETVSSDQSHISMSDIHHPIFSNTNHPMFNVFKELKMTKFKLGIGFGLEIFAGMIFENKTPDQLKATYDKKGLIFNSSCGKSIPSEHAYYMCLDCDKIRKNDITLHCVLCKQCFFNSNHFGHRVLMSMNKDEVMTCDCGDPSVFEAEGFCEDHFPKEVSIEEIRKTIGSKTVKKFNEIMSASFYGLFSLFDMMISVGKMRTAQNTNHCSNLISNIHRTYEAVLGGIFDFFSVLITNVNKAFIPIIAEFLESKFPTAWNLLQHDCQELTKTIYRIAPRPCTCKIGDLLLKNIQLVTLETQMDILDVLSSLCSYREFHRSLGLSYMKHIYFLFYQTVPGVRMAETCSKLVELDTNVFSNNEDCAEMVKSKDILHSFLRMISETLLSFPHPHPQLSILMEKLLMILRRLIRPGTEFCRIMLKDEMIGVSLLSNWVDFNATKVYPCVIYPELKNWEIDLHFVKCTLEVQDELEAVFKRVICQLAELGEEDQEKAEKILVDCWRRLFNMRLKEEDEGTTQKTRFVPIFGRSANHLMRKSDMKISQERIVSFLEQIKPGDLVRSAELLLQDTLTQVGVLRKIYFTDEMTRSFLAPAYYPAACSIIETDIVSMQMLIPYLNRGTCFKYLVENWFNYGPDIREYVLTEAVEEKKLLYKNSEVLLEDFLNLLVVVMIDEICLLRLMLSKDPRDYSKELDCAETFKKVNRKVFLTNLACDNWADAYNTGEDVKKLLWENSSETFLAEIAIKDEKTEKIKLKEEFYEEMDLFMFSHRKYLVRDLLTNFQNLDPKKTNVDTISGKYYTDLPDYCYSNQKVLFESDLPQFLARELLKEEFNSFSQGERVTLRPILRLVLMNFQCIPFLKEKGVEVALIRENVEKNYLRAEFRASLVKVLENDQMKDYHLVVKKILNLINGMMGEEQEENSQAKAGKTESPDADKKKKLAEQKMKELKEKFSNKQKAFMDSFSKELGETHLVKEETKQSAGEEEEGRVQCTLCLHLIDREKESYGFPCYVNFANHLSQATFRIAEQEDESFPVLHGCEHLFHYRCFLEWRAKTYQSDSAYRHVLFLQDTYCPLCTMLSNAFCRVNDKDEKEIIEEKSMLQVLANLTLYAARSADNTRVKDFGLVKQNADITQGIYSLRNMYWLFLENPSFFDKKNFSKKFRLYADFLVRIKKDTQGLKDVFTNFKNAEPEEGDMITLESVFVYEFLYEVLFSETFPKEILVQKMKNFIADKFKESFACSMIFSGGGSHQDPASFMMNAEQEVLLNEFKQLFKRILALFAFAEHLFKPEGDTKALRGITSENEEDLSFYFEYFGIKSPSEFMAEVLQAKSLLSPLQTKFIQGKITGLQEGALQKSKYLLSANLQVHKFDFPENYQDFIDKYMTHECHFCDGYPRHGEKIICLICGEVMCKAYCTKKGIHFPLANGSMHALEHCGIGVYLEVFFQRLIFVNAPKNLFLKRKYLYVNESRESIVELASNVDDKRVDNLNFKKFKVNMDIVKYVYSMIEGFTIPLEMFTVARTNAILSDDNAF